jgi:hypothetical protein
MKDVCDSQLVMMEGSSMMMLTKLIQLSCWN